MIETDDGQAQEKMYSSASLDEVHIARWIGVFFARAAKARDYFAALSLALDQNEHVPYEYQHVCCKCHLAILKVIFCS